jgi:hypothetical protein
MDKETYKALKCILAQIHAEPHIERRFDKKYLLQIESWIDEVAKEYEEVK